MSFPREETQPVIRSYIPLFSPSPSAALGGASSAAILTGYVDRANVTLAVSRATPIGRGVRLMESSFSLVLRYVICPSARFSRTAATTGFRATASVITCAIPTARRAILVAECFSTGGSSFSGTPRARGTAYCHGGRETGFSATPDLQAELRTCNRLLICKWS